MMIREEQALKALRGFYAVCHDKLFVIPGTEDMTEAYHDYWFHIKGALLGMVLGIPPALMAGVIVICGD